jgi:hypothetical protein
MDVERTSFVPSEAWSFVPAREFNYSQCKDAKEYARRHKLALFSCEYSPDSHAMCYFAGCWESTVGDAILRRQLWTRSGTSDIVAASPESLGSVYECVNGSDQQVLPYYDLEYYANAAHGNESCPDIDAKTQIVADLSTALMAALFPSQVQLNRATASTPAVVSPKALRDHVSLVGRICEMYQATQHGEGRKTVPVAVIDPERDWCVLDASRGEKRSQHLILSPDANVCWDTQIDQAIFVGLLIRCIYDAAILPVSSDTDNGRGGLADRCRQLFITNQMKASTATKNENPKGEAGSAAAPPKATTRVWELFVDPVVYKVFQLIRTAFSSKRADYRPLLPKRHTTESKKWHLEHTLVTRVPTDPAVTQRLSFARSYPQLFQGPERAESTPSAHLPLDQWKWVPNYLAHRDVSPPTAPCTSATTPHGPWCSSPFQEHVRYWLALTDPTRRIEDSLMVRPDSAAPPLRQSIRSVGPPATLEYRTKASECIAAYLRMMPNVRPWFTHFRDMTAFRNALVIKPTLHENPATGARHHTALVTLNLSYCPIHGAEHQSGLPFMVINGGDGTVRVRCLAGKCRAARLLLPYTLLPEQLAVIFPPESHAKSVKRSNPTTTTTSASEQDSSTTRKKRKTKD